MSTMYDQSTLGTPSNSITFNNFSASPIFRVRQTLPERRQIREQDAQVPEGMGVEDYDAFEAKLYFVISGTMYPKTEDEYYRGREKLRKLASLEVEQSDTSSDTGYVPYVWTEAGRPRQMFVKVMYVDGLGENTKQGFAQPFSLYCKIEYPVIFGTIPITTTLSTSSVVTVTGGVLLPVRLPVTIGGNSGSAGGTLVNTGTLASYPTIVINGPITSPVITNTTTGEYLGFNTTLLAGQSANLTYNQSKVNLTGANGFNIYNQMTSGSTLFKVKPGTNNFTLNGTSLSSNTSATISILDAYPIS
jgi:hypothetical protein